MLMTSVWCVCVYVLRSPAKIYWPENCGNQMSSDNKVYLLLLLKLSSRQMETISLKVSRILQSNLDVGTGGDSPTRLSISYLLIYLKKLQFWIFFQKQSVLSTFSFHPKIAIKQLPPHNSSFISLSSNLSSSILQKKIKKKYTYIHMGFYTSDGLAIYPCLCCFFISF